MKLQKLSLRDFLNHRDTTLEFGDLTVIVGPNNAGKSAVKDAIEMLLTGTARTTDKAGRDAADVIRTGAGHFDLRAEVAAAGDADAGGDGESRLNLVISRSKSRAGDHVLEISEEDGRTWEGPIPQKQKALFQALGANGGVVRACLHAGQLPSMKPDEQESLVFGTLGLDFTDARVCELLQTSGCTEDDVQLLYAGRDNTFLAAPSRESYGPEIFDEAYKYAYEKRRQTKRDLGKVQEALDAAGERVSSLERETPKLAQLDAEWQERNEATLEKLKEQRDELVRVEGRADALPKELERLEAERDDIKAQIAKVKAWLKQREKLADGGDFEKQCIKVKERYEDLTRAEHNLESELEILEAAIDAFSRGTPTCPLTDAECPMSKDGQAALLKSLRAKRTAAKKRRTSGKKSLDETTKALEKYRAVADSTPDRDVDGLQADLAAVEAKLRKLKAEKKKGSSDEIETLGTRIERGRGLLRKVENYLQAKQELGRHKVAHEKQLQLVESWERLVKALGPGGAKLKAVKEPLLELEERINERLAEFTMDYAVAFETEGGFEIKAYTPSTGEVFIPMKGLSTSERLRVGIALQDALAYLSGLRFLLIDNLDMLDAKNRAAIGKALQAWRSDYETIVLLMTGVRPAGPIGDATYWFEAGVAEAVTA